jgi:broad specificity phosphatase PhoE
MQERKIILIKHASPFVVPGTPPERWKLSDQGRESCGPLAEALRAHAPTVIVASQEPKAEETARLVGEKLGVPAETASGLHEHDRSNVPHMRSGEFISHMELFFRRPRELVLGSETAQECAERFEDAIAEVLATRAQGNVAIVSHGTAIALFIARHSQENDYALWRRMGLPSFAVLALPDLSVEQIVDQVVRVARP